VKSLAALLLFGLSASALAQQNAPANVVAQQPAPVRLTFGMISGNKGFVRSAFSEGVMGSILDATSREPRTETRQGPDAVAELVSSLPKLTGEIRDGKCAPGEAGKFACEFTVKRRNRQLQAFIDVENELITSVIFAVTGDKNNG